MLAPARRRASGRSDDDGPASNLGELLADPIDARLFGPRKQAEAAPKPAGQLGRRDKVEFSDARFDSDLFSENPSVPETELMVAAGHRPGRLAARKLGRGPNSFAAPTAMRAGRAGRHAQR